MDFGNLDVRKKLEQLVSPTGLAILPIYSFYKEFSTDNERDPCIMVKVIRYIIQHNSQSEDKMFMFQYCEKASALRNLVLHNQDYEDIIQCYKSFVGTVQKIRDCINIGKIQCDDAKSSMNKLNQFILQINSMIYIKTEKLQIGNTPVIGTYDVDYCISHFGAKMCGCKVIIHRTHPELLTLDMGIVVFNKWNGTNINVLWNGTIKTIKKYKILEITIVDIPIVIE